MDKSFDDEPVERGVKRKHGASGREAQAERHKNWLHRSDPAVEPAAWRPLPRYRVNAKHVQCYLDLQFRTMTGHGGLSFFKMPDLPTKLWQHWSTWPHLCISSDLGSDNNSAYHSLERQYGLNCDLWNDWWHGDSRDFTLAVQDAKLWPTT